MNLTRTRPHTPPPPAPAPRASYRSYTTAAGVPGTSPGWVAEVLWLDAAHEPGTAVPVDLAAMWSAPDGLAAVGVRDVWVAYDSGEPAGVVAVRRFHRDASSVSGLWVRPTFRGQGVATALLRRAIRSAGDHATAGQLYARLPSLSSHRTAGRALLTRCRFAPVAGDQHLWSTVPPAPLRRRP